MNFTEEYWDTRYKSNNTGWDLSQISPPLKKYFDALDDKHLRILIPGGGNSYEAEYLHKQGFTNVFVADLSTTALNNIKQRVPSFPKENLLHQNFFDLDLKFDLIVEQTFFCALNPDLRTSYVHKAASLLTENGRIAGLLFNKIFEKEGPPFGGTMQEYESLFSDGFMIKTMENCYNSHPARQGTELFIEVFKK